MQGLLKLGCAGIHLALQLVSGLCFALAVLLQLHGHGVERVGHGSKLVRPALIHAVVKLTSLQGLRTAVQVVQRPAQCLGEIQRQSGGQQCNGQSGQQHTPGQLQKGAVGGVAFTHFCSLLARNGLPDVLSQILAL